ncbi:MAG: hypothetical protein NC086_09455, partial [Alistipes sp.]|nr:hypothetical protein [Alistipes sp.]
MAEWEIISTVLILTVLVIRKCCKGKIPHRLLYGLWLVALIRLLIPVTPVESSFSVLNFLPEQWEKQGFDEKVIKGNDEENIYDAFVLRDLQDLRFLEELEKRQENMIEKKIYLPGDFAPGEYVADGTINSTANSVVNSAGWELVSLNEPEADVLPDTDTQTGRNFTFPYRIWFAGVVFMAVFLAAVNLKFYARVRKNSTRLEDYGKLKVYDTKEVLSPCLFGIFAPAIYLDGSRIASETAKEHILLH